MGNAVIKWILKHEAILVILSVVALLRIPSLFEPYWYGDEGIYLTIGQAMRKGVELYKGIHDNKPPFLYLVAMISQNQFWFRFIALLWNLSTVVAFWTLTHSWWQKREPAVWTTVAFGILTSIPFVEGNVANAELFFLLLTVASFGILLKENGLKKIAAAGLLLGLAALFKIPAMLEVGVWPVYWLISGDRRWIKKSFVLGGVALSPLIISIFYYWSRGTLPAYLIAAGLQNVPYLASWRAVNGPVGTLAGRMVILTVLLLVTWLWRKKISTKTVLLCVWWGITLFAALLSGRPYPHYLLQMAPVVTIGMGMVVWGRFKEKIVVAAATAILVGAFVVFKFYTYKTLDYYANFGRWVSGQINTVLYYDWFGKSVNRDYRIAKLIIEGSREDEKLFVWGDAPTIYALTKRTPVGKYAVKYHIKDFGAEKETIASLQNDSPRYVVVVDEPDLTGLGQLLGSRYIMESQVDEARAYRRVDIWKN